MADELIEVTKDGETIRVHPLALEDHKRLGWKVVGEAGEVETTSAPTEESEGGDGKRRIRRRVGTTSAPTDKDA